MATSFVGAHKPFFSLLLLVVAGIIAFQATSYYYYSRLTTDCPNPCSVSDVPVDTLINYGNGTSIWINKTDVPSKWNFYNLTASIARVDAKYYGPPTSEHLILGINGVQSNSQFFWSLWAVCQKTNAWTATGVGADAIHVTTYRAFAWYYQQETSQDSSKWNPPVAGALKVTSC